MGHQPRTRPILETAQNDTDKNGCTMQPAAIPQLTGAIFRPALPSPYLRLPSGATQEH